MTESRYIPGDYWVVCDRCGFKRRVSTTRKTWDKLLVCYPECWEPRHPQEFVRAKADRQAVPIARPDRDFPMKPYELAQTAPAGQQHVVVNTADTISTEASIGVVLDSGATQWFPVLSTEDVSGDTKVVIGGYLFRTASSGNSVYVSNMDSGFISPGSVTASNL